MQIIELLSFINFAIFALWMSLIDLKEKRLPNFLMYLAISLSLCLNLGNAVIQNDLRIFGKQFLIALIIPAVFFLISYIYPKGIGAGDIKAMFLIGLALANLGFSVIVLSLALSFIIAAIFAIVFSLLSKKKVIEFPFGPYLFLPALLISALSTWQ